MTNRARDGYCASFHISNTSTVVENSERTSSHVRRLTCHESTAAARRCTGARRLISVTSRLSSVARALTSAAHAKCVLSGCIATGPLGRTGVCSCVERHWTATWRARGAGNLLRLLVREGRRGGRGVRGGGRARAMGCHDEGDGR